MTVAALPAVDHFFARHIALPVFPEIATRLLKTFGNDNIGLAQMAELIGKDGALSAKVLRLANSARYGANHDIKRLGDAATVLGTNTLRNLALAACLAETFPALPGLDSRLFWRHGMACAHYAVLLSRALDIDGETAYVGGLMLRTGQIIMLGTDAGGVLEVESKAHEPGSRFDWEQQRWGCAHSDVTAELTRRWQFPAELTRAFRACAAPLETRPFSSLAGVLRCAEAMADGLVEGVSPVAALVAGLPSLVTHLHLDLDWVERQLGALGDPGADAQQLLAA